jgi:ubiquinol-cytochrome c reductase cytochrome c subunit
VRSQRAVAPFLLLILWFGACGFFEKDVDPYRAPLADEAQGDGRTLYARDCAWCHGSGALGTERGPSLVSGTNGPALTDFVLSTGRMPLDDPQERSVRRAPVYSEAEIAAIVEYVKGFNPPGPDIPEIDADTVATPEGLELYLENCGACHAPTGVGAAITSGRGREEFPASIIAPSLSESTRVEIAEAIRTGPGTMPVFGTGTLSDEEMDQVVGYVVYLQDPDDRGGAPIGHIGPVVEGAVGWLVGIVALILLIRWIGTRTGED